MDEQPIREPIEDDLDPTTVRIWVEFSAWCSFVMAPIIWWLQGPSVSTDQYVIRSALVIVSFVVAVGMRIWAIVRPYPPAETSTSEPGPPSSSSSEAG